MVEKLKSRARKIHWSLAVKSAALAFVFLYSPIVFAALALVAYLVPWLRTREFLVPFILLVMLGGVMPVRLVSALAIGGMFYLLLGVKELVFVDRARAYGALTLFVCVVSALTLFRAFDAWGDASTLLASFAAGAFFFVFDRSWARQENRADGYAVPPPLAVFSKGMLALIITESFLVMMLLPVSFLHQTALFTIILAISFELMHTYLRGGLGRKRILTAASVFMALFAVTLTAVEWSVR